MVGEGRGVVVGAPDQKRAGDGWCGGSRGVEGAKGGVVARVLSQTLGMGVLDWGGLGWRGIIWLKRKAAEGVACQEEDQTAETAMLEKTDRPWRGGATGL